MISIILSELHDENIPVTEEEVEKRLAEKADDFLQASKKKDVA